MKNLDNNEIEKLRNAISYIEGDLLVECKLHNAPGGFVRAELTSFNDTTFFIEVTSGKINVDGAYTMIDFMELDRETLKITKY